MLFFIKALPCFMCYFCNCLFSHTKFCASKMLLYLPEPLVICFPNSRHSITECGKMYNNVSH